MSENVRELVAHSHACYEVLPYYIMVEDRPLGAAASSRRIHAGFNIELYILKNGHGPGPSPEHVLASALQQDVAETVSRHSTECCSIELEPLSSETVFMPDSGKQFQPWTELRIRITHARGLHEPAGPCEERALKEIQEQLHSIGVRQGKGR